MKFYPNLRAPASLHVEPWHAPKASLGKRCAIACVAGLLAGALFMLIESIL